MNILEVFNGNFTEKNNIIKTIDVNETIHKNGIFNILKNQINNYIVDDFNRDVLNILFNYFIGNEIFCNENNISLNKGIMLIGPVGTGKTEIMKCFKIYTSEIIKNNSFQFYYSNEVIDDVNIKGVEALEKFNSNYNGYKFNPVTCLIDDICSKNEVIKNYGTEISVIEQLISIRYNIFGRYDKLTHFTTNIYPNEMINHYDIRVVDRLREMCNIVELKGKSKRN
jgi:DNA replication protein DnaC